MIVLQCQDNSLIYTLCLECLLHTYAAWPLWDIWIFPEFGQEAQKFKISLRNYRTTELVFLSNSRQRI